jgi:hypothetical protein
MGLLAAPTGHMFEQKIAPVPESNPTGVFVREAMAKL